MISIRNRKSGPSHGTVTTANVIRALDEKNIDTSAQSDYHMAYSEALDTPNLA